MATTNLNINVVDKRMFKQSEAASYAGLPVKHFKAASGTEYVRLMRMRLRSGFLVPGILAALVARPDFAAAGSGQTWRGCDPGLQVFKKVESASAQKNVLRSLALHSPVGQRLRRAAKITGRVFAIHPTVRVNEDPLGISADFHDLVPCSIDFFGQYATRRARHVLKLNT